MHVGRGRFERNDINERTVIMAVSVTLRFNYPWNESEVDENEVVSCLTELSPEELIMAANNAGKPINIDVEVY